MGPEYCLIDNHDTSCRPNYSKMLPNDYFTPSALSSNLQWLSPILTLGLTAYFPISLPRQVQP